MVHTAFPGITETIKTLGFGREAGRESCCVIEVKRIAMSRDTVAKCFVVKVPGYKEGVMDVIQVPIKPLPHFQTPIRP